MLLVSIKCCFAFKKYDRFTFKVIFSTLIFIGSILSSTPSSMRSSATNNAGSSILEETTHSDLEVADFAISDSSSELFEDLNLAAQLRFNNNDEEENVKIRSGSVRTNQCGRLGRFPKKKSHSTQFYSFLLNISGGAAVLQAFGRAADNLLPDLVFSWVTGGQSNQKKPTARLNDEEDEQLEPRIIAGKYYLFWITPILCIGHRDVNEFETAFAKFQVCMSSF